MGHERICGRSTDFPEDDRHSFVFKTVTIIPQKEFSPQDGALYQLRPHDFKSQSSSQAYKRSSIHRENREFYPAKMQDASPDFSQFVASVQCFHNPSCTFTQPAPFD